MLLDNYKDERFLGIIYKQLHYLCFGLAVNY
ncbi:hypothetical protein CLV59_102148 [Chitinophaga dinghuensis]|uniref:Uncharacterized protein n=1 Tax=Chitinophaga dinghuensis TaxID=1539050 RepID=A0A327W4W8_9BACT|nr:hypothetical protein CLV59_102148 [Chitinophaga dinghuensis]